VLNAHRAREGLVLRFVCPGGAPTLLRGSGAARHRVAVDAEAAVPPPPHR
jgi:hypothetical protein